MGDCLIGFGSNMGDSRAIYQAVQDSFAQAPEIDRCVPSRLKKTTPVGGQSQDLYLNGALRIESQLDPVQLHQYLTELESKLGRVRRVRWGARSVDLDLLLFHDQLIEETTLTVPHPRMSFRRFVLEPAAEIASKMVHPTSGMTIEALLERINSESNHLLWFTQEVKQAKEILDECVDVLSDWQVEISAPRPASTGSLPKLLIHDVEVVAKPTCAPTLSLVGTPREQKLIELKAAIQAIAKT